MQRNSQFSPALSPKSGTESLRQYIIYKNNMLRKSILFLSAVPFALSAFAEDTANGAQAVTPSAAAEAVAPASAPSATPEFESDERLEEGFVTHYINNAIEKAMPAPASSGEMHYGRKVTDYVSAPKLGGYFIGKYAYTSQEGKHSGTGFSQRLMRFYVDGKILGDFAYRIQVQTNNDKFHVKDYFLEWQKYPELRVKFGQYKRAFGFENPMNPWDVGVGDYSQLTKLLTGHSDYIGAESSSNGGRDQGLQLQGDLFPIGKDGHRLLHYQVMLANGQGINTSDADSRKDVLGTLQLQPVKGLFVGFFGWTGSFTDSRGVTVSRNRYMLSAKYDANDWTFRSEYAHSVGHKLSDYQADGTWTGDARADAWYATVGVPCTPWLKTYVKYDVYRDGADWAKAKSIYSIAPNIHLHKNLMFQPQVNYVHDRSLAKADYCEAWLELYVRF